MALSDDDVREILRLIDESELDELRVETEGLSLHVVRGGAVPAPEADAGEPQSRAPAAAPGAADGGLTIESPMIGTFYRAPAPGAAPFVDVGTRVEPDTIVCIIEVMKMMNSIPAGVAGTIAEIHVENAQPVEYGQPLFRVEAVMTRAVDIVDTTTRDGNQSLWGATGLTAHDILSIAPTLERVGFHALDFTSSTHMAVSVRFHREDPWELIRLMRAAMPTTLLNFITTGMRFIAWQPCDEDVMRLAFRCVVRNGIRRFQFAEPANDPQALRRVARMAREEGVEEIVVGLTYSISPVHTHAYYAERLAALADCADIDRFYLKDPGGLLTPDAVRELAPHFVATGRTVELHSHCTIGLAPLVYMEGVGGRLGVLHTAVGPAGNGTSQPTVESTLRNLEAEGYAHRLDLDALARAGAYFGELVREKRLPPGEPREYDAAYYHHQLPGGMVTTTQRMLEEIRRPELFDAVLEEVVRVRAEMGYPILVTPVSQLIAYQATRNVIDSERWLERLRRDGALLPRPLRRVRRAARSGHRRPGAGAAEGRRRCATRSR